MKYEIGTWVMVVGSTDDTIDCKRIGKYGMVSGYNTNGMTGNTETDPLHIISFAGGETETFWFDELIPAPTKK